jgi:hypothetical protein
LSLPEGGLKDGARVRDLATVPWPRLRAVWEKAGKSAADWNHPRRAVSRFLSVLLDDVRHPFRAEVVRRLPALKGGKGTHARAHRRGLPVDRACGARARPTVLRRARGHRDAARRVPAVHGGAPQPRNARDLSAGDQGGEECGHGLRGT